MDREKTIHLSMELPLQAIDSLTRLVEGLQRLTQGPDRDGGVSLASFETEENSLFDAERYAVLAEEPSSPEGPSAPEDPSSPENLFSPEDALPAREGAPSQDAGIPVPAAGPLSVSSTPPEAEKAAAPGGEVPEPVRSVSPEPLSSVPDSPPPYAAPFDREPAAPERVRAAVSETGVEPAFAAREPYPSPLTPAGAADSGTDAMAVSLAFSRDDRRYDSGFPLY